MDLHLKTWKLLMNEFWFLKESNVKEDKTDRDYVKIS